MFHLFSLGFLFPFLPPSFAVQLLGIQALCPLWGYFHLEEMLQDSGGRYFQQPVVFLSQIQQMQTKITQSEATDKKSRSSIPSSMTVRSELQQNTELLPPV